MTIAEAKAALALKLNIDYSDIANNGLWTSADLLSYVQSGCQIAWDRHPWDFTDGAKTATLSSDDITAGYVDYPQDMVTGGATSLIVNGEEFPEANKLQYQDYLKWKRLNPNSTDRYWTEYKRFIFINMAACQAGQVFDVYGKLRIVTPSGDSDLLPFSPDVDNQEDSGNNAIVQLAYAEAQASEKLKQYDNSIKTEQKAIALLDKLWEPMKQYKTRQQVKDRPFFNVPNFFPGKNDVQRTNIGNF